MTIGFLSLGYSKCSSHFVMAFATCVATAIGQRRRQALLTCGILAPFLYVAMTLFVGLLWEGYSVVSRVVIHFPMQRKQLISIARRAELTVSRSSAFKTADGQAACAR